RLARVLDRRARRVRPDAREDRQAAAGVLDGGAEEARALLVVERGAFSGRPRDDETIRAARAVPVDQAAERREIDRAVAEGRHEGDEAAAEPTASRPRTGLHREAPA